MPAAIGLDVHKKETQACIVSSSGEVLEEKRFLTRPGSFRRSLSKYAGTPVVLEAVGFHRPIAKWLREEGFEVHLAHPRRLEKPRVKTDKVDAEHLAHLLRTNLLPEAWLAPEQVQLLRDLGRHRHFLGEESGRLRSKIKHDLLKHGHFLDENPVETEAGREWLRSLNIREVTSTLDLYELVRRQIRDIEKEIESVTTNDPRARLLQTIPGVGAYSALVILAEVGDFNRFPDAEKLASYAGFSIRQEQSGEKDWRGHITKEGNPVLRWILVEAARNHVRYCPESRIAKKHKDYAARKGNAKANVAAARALLHAMFAMIQKNEPFKVNPLTPDEGTAA